ncbi:MAG: hypothetical protein IJJ33_21365 [Victivallales bacterium]|nr:hypothetical protein [Victivallales bacterium]
MFDITFPRNGAILNHNYGHETADGLAIEVRGQGGVTGPVRVNGVLADFDGTGFSATVTLKEQFNTITAELEDSRGKTRREIQVVWDKKSFPRYDFFIDDHSFFLTEIARTRPASLFDHFYLAFLRRMHQEYGTKFTLNLFYRNDHDADKFTLDQFPDSYRSEWESNADWLRLAFHAYSEFPDRTYQNATAETLARDMDLIEGEIRRFAGEQTLTPPVALHWAMARPEAFHVFTDRNVRALEGQFINPRTGIEDEGSPDLLCDVGYFLNLDDSRYLEKQGVLYDFKHRLAFFKGDCTANLWTCPQIQDMVAHAAQSRREFISLASHEQYSFPHYFNYLPDHSERMETAIRDVTERGYAPVFFAQGFFGNTAWGE